MKKFLLVFFLLSVSAGLSVAQTVRWDGGASTVNWHDATNWDTDQVPTSANDVIIDNTHVAGDIFVEVSSGASANTVTLQSTGGSRSGSSVFLDVYDVLTVTGNVVLNNGGKAADLSLTGTGTLNIGGSISGTGFFDPNFDPTFSGINQNTTVVYNGGGSQNIYASTGYRNLTIDKSGGSAALTGNTSIAGTFSLANGFLDLTENGYTLTLGGTISSTSGAINGSSTSDITINNSGNGNLIFNSPQTIDDLNLNTTGSLTLGSNLMVNRLFQTAGDLNLSSGSTFTINTTYSRTAGSIIGNGGSLVLGGSVPSPIPLTGTFGNLTVDEAGITFTLANAININSNLNVLTGTFNKAALDLNIDGALSISTGATYSTSGGTTNLAGNLTNNGTYTSTGGTIVFDGSTSQSISGNPTTFTNVTVNNAAGVVLNTDVTVNNTLAMTNGELNLNGNDLIVSGAYTQTTGSITGTTSSTLTFNGSGTIASGIDISIINLVLDRPETITLTGPTQLNSVNLIQGTLDMGSNNLSLSGNFAINSTFTSTGSLTFNGSTLQTISGSVPVTLTEMIISNDVSNNHTDIDISTAINFTGNNNDLDADGAGGGIITLLSTSHIGGTAFIGPTIDGNTVSGEITMQRFINSETPPALQGGVYRYLASPVVGAVVDDWNSPSFPITGDFTGSSAIYPAPSMYYYDETVGGNLSDGWFEYPTTNDQEPLENGVGYAVYQYNSNAGSVTISSRGSVINTDVTLNATYTNTGTVPGEIETTAQEDANFGWNLLGNPFPSQFDWDNVTFNGLDDNTWAEGGVTAQVAVRDDANGGFVYYAQGSGTGTGGFDGIIASHQSFWVHVESPDPDNPTTSGSVTIPQTAKTSENATFYRTKEIEKEVFRVFMTNGEVTDESAIIFTPVGTKEYQPLYDAFKFKNDIINFSTLSSENKPLAINALSQNYCEDTVKLRIHSENAIGSYSFSFKGWDTFMASKDIYLVDNYKESVQEVTESTVYNFDITTEEGSYGEHRFELIFNGSQLPEPQIIRVDNRTLETSFTGNVQWFFNGELIEGATDNKLIMDTSGTYGLEIYDENGCSARTNIELTVTGIDNILGKERIRIYPNPVKDYLNIDVGNLSKAKVQVRDSRGKVLFVENLHEGVNQINLSHLHQGLYFVRIMNRNDELTLKVLKQ